MTSKEYKTKLRLFIDQFGFWSNEVFNLNNDCINEHGLSKYLKWHQEVVYDSKYKK